MKVLLAVDGSDESYDAVRAVECLAPAHPLTVLYVLDLPRLAYPTLGPNLDKELSLSIEKAMKEEGQNIVNRAASLLPPHHGTTEKRMVEGKPAEVILAVAEDIQADMIMLGARGVGQIREHVIGSVSHRVMTHASCPVFVVKAPLRHLQRMLIPIADADDGQAIVDFLSNNPFRERPEVTVVHVVPFSEPVWPVGAMIPEGFRKEMMSYGKEITNAVVEKLGPLGYTARGLAVLGAPAAAIAQEASASECDLIVMRSHTRPGISRFLLGSVSHGVVHQAGCSVLMLRRSKGEC